MSTFNLKEWMTENRNTVIEKHKALAAEMFFSGISLRDFMLTVMRTMQANRPTAKNAANTLANVMGAIYMDNIKVKTTYTTPYAESNHAKQVNYFGAQKAAMLNNI